MPISVVTSDIRNMTVAQLVTALEAAQSEHDNRLLDWKNARKRMVDTEDALIAARTQLGLLKEQYTETHYKEQTVVEASEEEAEMTEFRTRIKDVTKRQEAAGTLLIKDPITTWLADHPQEAERLRGHWVALAQFKGVLIAERDKDLFSIKYTNLNPGMREVANVFFADDYLGKPF